MALIRKQVDGPSVPNDAANIYFAALEALVGGQDAIAEIAAFGYVDGSKAFHQYTPDNPVPVRGGFFNAGARLTAGTAGDTAAVVVATALSGRGQLRIYNVGDADMAYLYDSGDPFDAGVVIAPQRYRDLPIGPAITPYLICRSGESTNYLAEEFA